uniref:Protein phosphatase inhibitor 2 n=1 Tax=Steinernema glaseri TaxID=37863 RepID=A0A1I7ZIC8_9BILA
MQEIGGKTNGIKDSENGAEENGASPDDVKEQEKDDGNTSDSSVSSEESQLLDEANKLLKKGTGNAVNSDSEDLSTPGTPRSGKDTPADFFDTSSKMSHIHGRAAEEVLNQLKKDEEDRTRDDEDLPPAALEKSTLVSQQTANSSLKDNWDDHEEEEAAKRLTNWDVPEGYCRMCARRRSDWWTLPCLWLRWSRSLRKRRQGP